MPIKDTPLNASDDYQNWENEALPHLSTLIKVIEVLETDDSRGLEGFSYE